MNISDHDFDPHAPHPHAPFHERTLIGLEIPIRSMFAMLDTCEFARQISGPRSAPNHASCTRSRWRTGGRVRAGGGVRTRGRETSRGWMLLGIAASLTLGATAAIAQARAVEEPHALGASLKAVVIADAFSLAEAITTPRQPARPWAPMQNPDAPSPAPSTGTPPETAAETSPTPAAAAPAQESAVARAATPTASPATTPPDHHDEPTPPAQPGHGRADRRAQMVDPQPPQSAVEDRPGPHGRPGMGGREDSRGRASAGSHDDSGGGHRGGR